MDGITAKGINNMSFCDKELFLRTICGVLENDSPEEYASKNYLLPKLMKRIINSDVFGHAEKMVLQAIYWDEKTVKMISTEHDISVTRVHTIHSKALIRLRKIMKKGDF